MSFAYNDAGLRISKTANDVTTHYVYDGDILVVEYTDSETIVYIYDAYDSPIGFKYRSNSYASDTWDVYWYGKNLQGDILHVYDDFGTKLVSYTYTAWGKTTISYSGSGASTTAVKNNLTYRGYYYDSDLGMYYLQSRYYDPNTCRFINADAALYHSMLGYNLFVYCENTPVTRVDPSGDYSVAIKDDDINPLNDWLFEGGVAGGGGLYGSPSFGDVIALGATVIIAAAIDKKDRKVSYMIDGKIESNIEYQEINGYTVYGLFNGTECVYVGRTKNVLARKYAHSLNPHRTGLEFVILEEDLDLFTARGLEQYYMQLHHTINAAKEASNQINGISPKNKKRFIYYKHAAKYLGNLASNEILNSWGI
jgi:RHS repeat-associated protein